MIVNRETKQDYKKKNRSYYLASYWNTRCEFHPQVVGQTLCPQLSKVCSRILLEGSEILLNAI